MNINDNKGNHRKLQKNKGYTYKITHISAAKCPFSVVLYVKNLILFFICIDEYIGNFRKITDIGVISTNLLISRLIATIYPTWFLTDAMTRSFTERFNVIMIRFKYLRYMVY